MGKNRLFTEDASLLWHTVPLHYLPYLLESGALLSAARLQAEGHPIRPRPTAIARKTKLGLADYVHLSLKSRTPLLADKRAKGYPHALIAWDRAAVLALPGVGLLRFNTKRWAHRDDFLPVTDPEEKAALLTAQARGRYPSLEVLVPERLPLVPGLAVGLYFASEAEREAVAPVVGCTGLPVHVSRERFGGEAVDVDLAPVRAYIADCVAAGKVGAPPSLPFD
jgi:hypothetical protein